MSNVKVWLAFVPSMLSLVVTPLTWPHSFSTQQVRSTSHAGFDSSVGVIDSVRSLGEETAVKVHVVRESL
jgi:hypothetical protein